MDDRAKKEDERWGEVMENFDLLFSKVAEIEKNQQKSDTRFDMSTQVLEQLLKDQKIMNRQLEATTQAVNKLTDNQKGHNQKRPQSPTYSEESDDHRFQQGQNRGDQGRRAGFNHNRRDNGERFSLKSWVPKMPFPKFEGDNPGIWKSKCLDYFQLFELPPSLWATMASLNMDGKAAKWLLVYKQTHGVDSWDTFIHAVEAKFGDNDYREALTRIC